MEEEQSSDNNNISAKQSKKINIKSEAPPINAQNFQFSGDLKINLTVIGKKKCGKSCLIKSYLKKSFESEKEDTTLDMYGKKILVLGHEVNLVIAEVSQDKADFQLAKEIIAISNIVFICYSLEDDIEKMNEDVIEGSIALIQTIKPSIPIFLVGCKFDLIKEEDIDNLKLISHNELTNNGKTIKEYINNKRETLKNNFCGYYITSALLNLNITELFNDAIKTVTLPIVIKYQREQEQNIEESFQNKSSNQKKKKGSSNTSINKTIIKVGDDGCIIF
jgi:GTPase SAR1 family protein